MARRVITDTISDISGELIEGDGEVSFALDGQEYEIDLTEAEREQLVVSLGRWIEHARKVRGATNTKRRRTRTTLPTAVNLTTVREWAKKQGLEVSERGRIAASTIKAFEDAHKPAEKAEPEKEAEVITPEFSAAPKRTRRRKAAAAEA